MEGPFDIRDIHTLEFACFIGVIKEFGHIPGQSPFRVPPIPCIPSIMVCTDGPDLLDCFLILIIRVPPPPESPLDASTPLAICSPSHSIRERVCRFIHLRISFPVFPWYVSRSFNSPSIRCLHTDSNDLFNSLEVSQPRRMSLVLIKLRCTFQDGIEAFDCLSHILPPIGVLFNCRIKLFDDSTWSRIIRLCL